LVSKKTITKNRRAYGKRQPQGQKPLWAQLFSEDNFNGCQANDMPVRGIFAFIDGIQGEGDNRRPSVWDGDQSNRAKGAFCRDSTSLEAGSDLGISPSNQKLAEPARSEAQSFARIKVYKIIRSIV
jgi:hypothetical protein